MVSARALACALARRYGRREYELERQYHKETVAVGEEVDDSRLMF